MMVFLRVFVLTVIPGRAAREPGIHNHDRRLWIPGLRQVAHPGMTAVAVSHCNNNAKVKS
jgi:hypothetical protein